MLYFLETFCYMGLIIVLVIFLRLLAQGRNINFINLMFVNVFLYEIIVGPFLIKSFFAAARKNWDTSPDPEKSVRQCGNW